MAALRSQISVSLSCAVPGARLAVAGWALAAGAGAVPITVDEATAAGVAAVSGVGIGIGALLAGVSAGSGAVASMLVKSRSRSRSPLSTGVPTGAARVANGSGVVAPSPPHHCVTCGLLSSRCGSAAGWGERAACARLVAGGVPGAWSGPWVWIICRRLLNSCERMASF